MRPCPNCGYQNPSTITSCLKCATPLPEGDLRAEPGCPVCGNPVPTGSKFCNQCGASLPLSPQPAPLAGPAMPRQPRSPQNLHQLMPASLAEKIRIAAGEITGERREVTVDLLHNNGYECLMQAYRCQMTKVMCLCHD